jgi:glutaredoxin
MASASQPKVIVYTTPTCPDCWSLKAWLEREGLAFEERDLSDLKIMAEAKARTGMRVAPITLVGNTVFYGTFQSQRPGLTMALGLSITA